VIARTGLERHLRDAGVNTVVVVGVITNNSVEGTLRMGGNLRFDMVLVENGCFTSPAGTIGACSAAPMRFMRCPSPTSMASIVGVVQTAELFAAGPPRKPEVSMADATVRAVEALGGAISAERIREYLGREFGMQVRPNHLGMALARHRRAGRLQEENGRWSTAKAEAGEALIS
jgi:hypothetical protein